MNSKVLNSVSPGAAQQLASVNGQITAGWDVQLYLRDHGALFAENVFEGLRIIDGALLDYSKHRERLYNSAQLLQLPLPDRAEFDRQARAILSASGLSQGYMRVVATRGAGGLGIDPRPCTEPKLFILVGPFALYPPETYEQGVAVIVAKTQKVAEQAINCSDIKHGNYLNNKLALYEALAVGSHDALMLTAEGYVSEGTVANVFAVRGDRLCTPALETNCLRGITRQTVLDLAAAAGLYSEEGCYSADDFRQAEEVFLTGTGAGLLAVHSIDGAPIGSGRCGRVTSELRSKFESTLGSSCEMP